MENLKKGHIDWLILLPVFTIMLFGLGFVYSASSSHALASNESDTFYFMKHLWKVLIGIVLIIVFAKIDYHIYRKFSKGLLFFSIILLVLVLFFGLNLKGANRWISVFGLTIQPSEIAKFAMVIHFASMLAAKQGVIKDFYKGFLPFLIWLGMMCLLIAAQPNFSTMMVVFAIGFAIMFVGNVNLLHLLTTGGIGVVFAGIFAISQPYRVKRFLAFMGEGSADDSFQLNQSLIALGNGGVFGVGPGQSRQSDHFLPEPYGDFIFSIVGEEIGFIGLLFLLLIFGMVFWRGMLIAKKAPDNFGYFLSVGIIITFAFYVFVNAGVNSGILPTTGVPFPFLSYGGTATLIYSAAIGILLNVSAQAGTYTVNEES
ncbi:putative peptidoglycan glycosyltransferase FtsW [Candidatus Kapabacteria bacterium]|nr:putative peptidoglycan glycosyltransferase FtsW [Candidatus Kapabacteria bacterium]